MTVNAKRAILFAFVAVIALAAGVYFS